MSGNFSTTSHQLDLQRKSSWTAFVNFAVFNFCWRENFTSILRHTEQNHSRALIATSPSHKIIIERFICFQLVNKDQMVSVTFFSYVFTSTLIFFDNLFCYNYLKNLFIYSFYKLLLNNGRNVDSKQSTINLNTLTNNNNNTSLTNNNNNTSSTNNHNNSINSSHNFLFQIN